MPEPTPPTALEMRHERTESARLDNFVDGAFAFAITLLIISGGSLPKNVLALEHALREVPAFAACFFQLAVFWHGHVRWRDTARLTDGTSLQLSLLLVFFALIFVFPLHLVYSAFFSSISGGALSLDFTRDITLHAITALFVCYGLSYACMAGTLALLFRHGARNALLPRADTVSANVSTAVWAYGAAVGLLSVLIALATGTLLSSGALSLAAASWVISAPGICYSLLGATTVVAKYYRARTERRLPA